MPILLNLLEVLVHAYTEMLETCLFFIDTQKTLITSDNNFFRVTRTKYHIIVEGGTMYNQIITILWYDIIYLIIGSSNFDLFLFYI